MALSGWTPEESAEGCPSQVERFMWVRGNRISGVPRQVDTPKPKVQNQPSLPLTLTPAWDVSWTPGAGMQEVVWGGWISESSALGGLEEGLLRKDRNSSGLLA